MVPWENSAEKRIHSGSFYLELYLEKKCLQGANACIKVMKEGAALSTRVESYSKMLIFKTRTIAKIDK